MHAWSLGLQRGNVVWCCSLDLRRGCSCWYFHVGTGCLEQAKAWCTPLPDMPHAQHHSTPQLEQVMCMQPSVRCVRTSHDGQGRVCCRRYCRSGDEWSVSSHLRRCSHVAGQCGAWEQRAQ
jgi:hypothetical protein